MRLLHPLARDDVGFGEIYDVDRPARADRPYVLVNMVASVDGATVVSGVTESLGSAGDRRLFVYLRSVPDLILVGAQTVRAESYGPAMLTPELREARTRRGEAPVPRIAVVSRSLDLDLRARFFTVGQRPLVLAPEQADAGRLARVAEVAELITTPGSSVDLSEALRVLRGRGIAMVLCEGGPALNAQLLQAGLIDELCLTLSPHLVGGGGGPTIMGGAALAGLQRLSLASVMEDEGFLFLRYLLTAP